MRAVPRRCDTCKRTLPLPRPGQPAPYCRPCAAKKPKSGASRRTSPPGRPAHADPKALLIYAAQELQRAASGLMDAAHADVRPADLLELKQGIAPLFRDVEAAIVHAGRRRGDDWQVLGAPLEVSGERLRKRWNPASLDERLTAITEAREAARTRPADSDTAATPLTPAQQLAAALTVLHRATGRSIASIATDVGVHPSHLSRVFKGKSRPSWHVVEQLAAACGGHAAELRDLWDAAVHPAAPAPALPAPGHEAQEAFHTALRALYLADGLRSPDKVCLAIDGALTVEEIRDVLAGRVWPEWTIASRLILALGGRPSDLNALHLAAELPAPGPRLQASSFG
ncbi:helix-turn-helix domain-containing protein [Streptomyces sp. 12297]